MHITFLGNFGVDFSSETHHVKSIEALGHTVTKLQEGEATSQEVLAAAYQSDIFVWVHTHGWNTPGEPMRNVLKVLKENNIPTLTYHLDLWLGLDRQKDMQKDDYWYIEHFFTADANMAVWLNKNTEIKGHYLPAGVFHEECYMVDLPKKYDVVFVGSRGYHPEWPYRPKLIDWLKTTYGDRFFHFGGDGLGVVRGHELNKVYGQSKVVVGDTLCLNFNYPNYFSDRLFETTGRGGFLIFPDIKGIDDLFIPDGEPHYDSEIIKYPFDNFEMLKHKIDTWLKPENEKDRERIRKNGFERTKNHHTYLNRWQTIFDKVKNNE